MAFDRPSGDHSAVLPELAVAAATGTRAPETIVRSLEATLTDGAPAAQRRALGLLRGICRDHPSAIPAAVDTLTAALPRMRGGWEYGGPGMRQFAATLSELAAVYPDAGAEALAPVLTSGDLVSEDRSRLPLVLAVEAPLLLRPVLERGLADRPPVRSPGTLAAVGLAGRREQGVVRSFLVDNLGAAESDDAEAAGTALLELGWLWAVFPEALPDPDRLSAPLSAGAPVVRSAAAIAVGRVGGRGHCRSAVPGQSERVGQPAPALAREVLPELAAGLVAECPVADAAAQAMGELIEHEHAVVDLLLAGSESRSGFRRATREGADWEPRPPAHLLSALVTRLFEGRPPEATGPTRRVLDIEEIAGPYDYWLRLLDGLESATGACSTASGESGRRLVRALLGAQIHISDDAETEPAALLESLAAETLAHLDTERLLLRYADWYRRLATGSELEAELRERLQRSLLRLATALTRGRGDRETAMGARGLAAVALRSDSRHPGAVLELLDAVAAAHEPPQLAAAVRDCLAGAELPSRAEAPLARLAEHRPDPVRRAVAKLSAGSLDIGERPTVVEALRDAAPSTLSPCLDGLLRVARRAEDDSEPGLGQLFADGGLTTGLPGVPAAAALAAGVAAAPDQSVVTPGDIEAGMVTVGSERRRVYLATALALHGDATADHRATAVEQLRLAASDVPAADLSDALSMLARHHPDAADRVVGTLRRTHPDIAGVVLAEAAEADPMFLAPATLTLADGPLQTDHEVVPLESMAADLVATAPHATGRVAARLLERGAVAAGTVAPPFLRAAGRTASRTVESHLRALTDHPQVPIREAARAGLDNDPDADGEPATAVDGTAIDTATVDSAAERLGTRDPERLETACQRLLLLASASPGHHPRIVAHLVGRLVGGPSGPGEHPGPAPVRRTLRQVVGPDTGDAGGANDVGMAAVPSTVVRAVLDDPDPSVRRQGLHLTRWMVTAADATPSERRVCLDAARTTLDDPVPAVRAAAATTLGRAAEAGGHTTDDTASALAARLGDDPDVAAAAAEALGWVLAVRTATGHRTTELAHELLDRGLAREDAGASPVQRAAATAAGRIAAVDSELAERLGGPLITRLRETDNTTEALVRTVSRLPPESAPTAVFARTLLGAAVGLAPEPGTERLVAEALRRLAECDPDAVCGALTEHAPMPGACALARAQLLRVAATAVAEGGRLGPGSDASEAEREPRERWIELAAEVAEEDTGPAAVAAARLLARLGEAFHPAVLAGGGDPAADAASYLLRADPAKREPAVAAVVGTDGLDRAAVSAALVEQYPIGTPGDDRALVLSLAALHTVECHRAEGVDAAVRQVAVDALDREAAVVVSAAVTALHELAAVRLLDPGPTVGRLWPLLDAEHATTSERAAEGVAELGPRTEWGARRVVTLLREWGARTARDPRGTISAIREIGASYEFARAQSEAALRAIESARDDDAARVAMVARRQLTSSD